MAGIFSRLSGWWSRDKLERADEGTHETQQERDIEQEDFEAQKDDVAIKGDFYAGGVADYEHDSEKPGHPRDR
jgi:hypothetical protein